MKDLILIYLEKGLNTSIDLAKYLIFTFNKNTKQHDNLHSFVIYDSWNLVHKLNVIW
jgi:hypothetical protein